MVICCQHIVYPQTLLEWVQLLSYVVSSIGILIAGTSYARNKKQQKAEWLESLFEKFYESDNYKEVRKWIDYDKDENLLKSKLENDESHDNEEKLADFLNFFEFIATLEKQKQLSVDEINNLFAYYLTLINSNEICLKFISKYKFLNLLNYLNSKHHDKK